MTAMPPLFPDSLDLAASVNTMCDVAGLDSRQRRAALSLLGQLIADGETNHVETVRIVAEVIQENPARLLEIAAEDELLEARRRATANRSGAIPKTPAKPGRTQPAIPLRYDLESDSEPGNPL